MNVERLVHEYVEHTEQQRDGVSRLLSRRTKRRPTLATWYAACFLTGLLLGWLATR